MLVVGLDIGGANLKAATSDAAAIDRPFPLWQFPERLVEELELLLAALPRPDLIAVTMTGEIADCFPSKAEGVRQIVQAARLAAAGRPLLFWQTGDEFVGPDEATDLSRLVAAANWHALATFSGRVVPRGAGLLIDVGSTTTDIVPLVDGRVVAAGLTDLERLRTGELIYTGATRTPVCALGSSFSLAESSVTLAAELFATMRDVYLLLGMLAEEPLSTDTADGRPATREYALRRLARMLCSDPDEVGDDCLHAMATELAGRQRMLIRWGLEQVLDRLAERPQVLISGSGAFVAQQVLAETPSLAGVVPVTIAELFERNVSRSACAFAVARLAAERVTL